MNVIQMHGQCLRKAAFRDSGKAQKVADKHNKLNPPGDGKFFHVYSCPLCFRYHIGRTSLTPPKKGNNDPNNSTETRRANHPN